MGKRVITITVRFDRGRGYHYILIPHQAKNVEELRLPEIFYKDTKLEFPLYEVEIVEPLIPRGETEKFNYHYSDKDNKPYVCYPGPITTEEKLLFVLKVWTVGQVCVRVFNEYLNKMIEDAGGIDKFLPWAEEKCVRIIGFRDE